jgi:ferredoxin
MGVRTDLTSKIIKAGFNQRFFMARMTRLPVLGHAVEFAFFEKDEMIYLPKDKVVASPGMKTIAIGKEVSPQNIVLPSQIIEHFLRRSRYVFIMNSCMCRDSNHCSHYPHELGCIFLGSGVPKIPAKMGRMASADEAIDHMRKAREKGLVHLIGRNKIDNVWLNTGPKEDLLSICNCCECCCLWKMMPQLSDSISNGVMRMAGVTVSVTDACTGCGKCVKDHICFVSALSMKDHKAMIDQTKCKGCGRCVEHCPSKAIVLELNDPQYFEKSIQTIEPLVDVTKV